MNKVGVLSIDGTNITYEKVFDVNRTSGGAMTEGLRRDRHRRASPSRPRPIVAPSW